jgi:predicted O-methyltransferase YrrM
MEFTKSWFYDTECKELMSSFRLLDTNRALNVLEIGCYEGLSTCSFASNLLKHENSRLYAVDPFTTDPLLEMSSDIYERFKKNISLSDNSEKILFFRETSDDFFEHLPVDTTFDFIYIDGAHTVENITRDLNNSFPRLNPGGVMFIDDYMGGHPTYPYKDCIDGFLQKNVSLYKLVHRGYRVGIQKGVF